MSRAAFVSSVLYCTVRAVCSDAAGLDIVQTMQFASWFQPSRPAKASGGGTVQGAARLSHETIASRPLSDKEQLRSLSFHVVLHSVKPLRVSYILVGHAPGS